MSGDDLFARAAYHNFTSDWRRALCPRGKSLNGMLEFSSEDETLRSINYANHTFTIRFSGLDSCSFEGPPKKGHGWALVDGGWIIKPTASLVRDAVTSSVVSAPSRADGQVIICYRISWMQWIAAKVRWLLRMITYTMLSALCVAAVAFAAYHMPWSTIFRVLLGLFRSVPQEPVKAEPFKAPLG